MNASRWAASASEAGGGVRMDAICTAFSPAVTSAYRSASFSLSRGSAMRATALRVARSGIGTSTTATLGFDTIFGARSLRFSATSRMMLSPFSIAGSDDQRCSMMIADRSASAWNVGSPAGASDSAYSQDHRRAHRAHEQPLEGRQHLVLVRLAEHVVERAGACRALGEARPGGHVVDGDALAGVLEEHVGQEVDEARGLSARARRRRRRCRGGRTSRLRRAGSAGEGPRPRTEGGAVHSWDGHALEARPRLLSSRSVSAVLSLMACTPSRSSSSWPDSCCGDCMVTI